MTGFTITITDAGRAALINAQNTGTNAFVLSRIGVSTQAISTPLASLTVLPNERKKLSTMAGDVVADDTLHVTIRDETNDAYALRSFGIYTSTGILFAVYSQADPIIEKSAAAMLLLAVDARLLAITTDDIEFGPVGFTLPPASETVAGISEVATDAECDAGTDNWRFITPRLLKRALQALSGFAAIGHKHDADDVNSGVFNAGRIPALGMEKITGLAVALAGKAAEVHTHTISQITGLVDALAGKATSVHQHHADDIVQGVLAVARIPALGMEKITGLAASMAAKAESSAALMMRGLMTGITPQSAQQPGAWRQSSGAEATTENGYPVADLAGTLAVFAPMASNVVQLYFGTDNRAFLRQGNAGDFSRWYEFHTNANFDPLNFTGRVINGGSTGVTITGSGGLAVAGSSGLSVTGAQGVNISSTQGLSFSVNDVRRWQLRPVQADGNLVLTRNDPVTGASLGNMLVLYPDGRGLLRGDFNIDGTLTVGTNAVYHAGNLGNATTSTRGLAQLASNSQVQAGTDSTRSITPAALWSFAKSIGTSGYQQIPGTGLIIQWGSSNTSFNEGTVQATLPIAFGGGCLVALAIPRNAAGATARDYYMQVYGRYQDRIMFYANHANSSSGTMVGFEWMAIGRATGSPDPVFTSGGNPNPGGGGGGGDDGGIIIP